MEPINFTEVDESRYRTEVLLLPSEESETAQEQKLVEDARQLGLKVPEVEVVASLAASIASGMVDLSSPIRSSGSSTDRNSTYEVVPSIETPPQIDQLASSLSDFTVASEPVQGGSTRSFASMSTRPTSYSSFEGRLAPGIDSLAARPPGNRASMFSMTSADKRERRKSTLKSAIGKIHFRKKRSPSPVLLPPAAQITVAKGEKGVERVYVESRPSEAQNSDSAEEDKQVLRLEIPVFDNESMQRSLHDAQLYQMRESHIAEMNRHNAFQDAFMAQLRRRQQSIVADQLAENKRAEEKKREKNTADAVRMEERQLTVEMEQMREFERAKVNARTRIKYMEGFFNNSSPPPSPVSSSKADVVPSRKFTAQHKAQLAQEYHDHNTMDQLHQAKIKVLRDRQELRLQEAIARMERELDDMIDKHALEFAQMQQKHQQEEADILQAFDAKKSKLRHRWALEEAILRKKLEVQHGQPYGPLPPLSFSDSHYETRDSAICVTDQTGAASGDEGPVHHKRGGQVL
ncbi:hypothetical protein CBS115989_6598 [Aspergillus niger]|uniref:Contig An02c0440, genomic contig n=3 Tax=Aspergillus niger TaxID=5061 RepID=A2QF63_ASPNC|nr:uncharacterized protein An02g13430 [Aspergillus niger]RDH23315.1 hypothetical protein M747DRAFT_232197 [Aspergillus niger ATCC 13496]KAI2816670.1 hypothetical protein CBS115989_6598 [Aspergillus niger]KAI2851956.1 hypothetical protein CBS11232_5886 [Aspergillus niger]KAI2873877.1 hypothetical protein CBS115988_6637 [Aspergillus niger]CAK47756.1 unnamed protein product [Aspergillus niger]|eukprot:XP_001400474.1 hypothetical protein ANI_1_3258024 [Aspergillus niger CBS 513.88]